MDKRVIFAVAGSGKTTHIVNSLNRDKRSLIVTYTNANYRNLQRKIIKKFDGKWPETITLMSYFSFLYGFCFKPFLADRVNAKGIYYGKNEKRGVNQTQPEYYKTDGRYLYSNRLVLLLEKQYVIADIKERITTYFDEFVIDEVQDISGRDFNFLEHLMDTDIDLLFVGDFYQHTFDTSRDGNVNQSLFNDKKKYEKRFSDKGLYIDNETLTCSWRCGKKICDFIQNNLEISIDSNKKDDNCNIEYLTDKDRVKEILHNDSITKLHYQNAADYGNAHRNWGDTKGEDDHADICVLLNKKLSKIMSRDS